MAGLDCPCLAQVVRYVQLQKSQIPDDPILDSPQGLPVEEVVKHH